MGFRKGNQCDINEFVSCEESCIFNHFQQVSKNEDLLWPTFRSRHPWPPGRPGQSPGRTVQENRPNLTDRYFKIAKFVIAIYLAS